MHPLLVILLLFVTVAYSSVECNSIGYDVLLFGDLQCGTIQTICIIDHTVKLSFVGWFPIRNYCNYNVTFGSNLIFSCYCNRTSYSVPVYELAHFVVDPPTASPVGVDPHSHELSWIRNAVIMMSIVTFCALCNFLWLICVRYSYWCRMDNTNDDSCTCCRPSTSC
jgi:hypothetical protein